VKIPLMMLLGFGWALGARAEITTNATYDELFHAATRYGNTEARREDKEAARTEFSGAAQTACARSWSAFISKT
jgi:hypothetical protein